MMRMVISGRAIWSVDISFRCAVLNPGRRYGNIFKLNAFVLWSVKNFFEELSWTKNSVNSSCCCSISKYLKVVGLIRLVEKNQIWCFTFWDDYSYQYLKVMRFNEARGFPMMRETLLHHLFNRWWSRWWWYDIQKGTSLLAWVFFALAVWDGSDWDG